MSEASQVLAPPTVAATDPQPRALYVGGPGDEAFGVLHPAAGQPRGRAVLICPPFGNSDNGSYMPRRVWAQHLARDGRPTLRIDLPRSGDSPGGPRDPDVLGAWVRGVDAAARWLRASYGLPVAAIGLGLGGMVACLAAAGGAPIDDLVLWAVPSRGRQFIRELTIFERMLASRTVDEDSTGAPVEADTGAGDGSVESAGFVLSGETVTALRDVDLSRLTFPGSVTQRALLLDRDGMQVDERLSTGLQDAGVAVRSAPGPGFWMMMAAPYESEPPRQVMATVDRWLAEAPAQPSVAPEDPPTYAEAVVLEADGARVRETPVVVGHPAGDALGILTEPVDDAADRRLTLVLVNSGALRRMGPNRMWVELARRWAARGVTSLRIDLTRESDLSPVVLGRWHAAHARPGDIEWDHFDASYALQYSAAIDFLQARATSQRFLVAGLSSGAYWSLRQLLEDDRVGAGVLVNPGRLSWNEHERLQRDVGKLRSGAAWRRLARGEIPTERLVQATRAIVSAALRRSAAPEPPADDLVSGLLDRLQSLDQQLTFLFARDEPLARTLQASGELDTLRDSPQVTVEMLQTEMKGHVLESVTLQHLAHEVIDRAVVRALDATAG